MSLWAHTVLGLLNVGAGRSVIESRPTVGGTHNLQYFLLRLKMPQSNTG